MNWKTCQSLYDTLAIQLADLTWDLYDALARGRITDVNDVTEPCDADEIAAAVDAAARHLVGAARELHNLAIQPIRTPR